MIHHPLIPMQKDRILGVRHSRIDMSLAAPWRIQGNSLAILQPKYQSRAGRLLGVLCAGLLSAFLGFGAADPLFAQQKSNAKAKSAVNFSKSAKSRKTAKRTTRRRTGAKRRRTAQRAGKVDLSTPGGLLGSAIDLAGKGRFEAARARARKSGLEGAEKLIGWLVLQHTGATATSAEINAFLEQNPDWPRRDRLLARAEAAQYFRPGSALETLAYFKDRPPETGAGMAALARAHKRQGDEKSAKMWLRRAWTTRRLGGGLETILRKDMGKWLRADDQRARAAYLTYVNDPRALLRMSKWLKDKDLRALTLAQASFLLRSRRAPRRLKGVPAALRSTPALAYARSRYWRMKNNNAKALAIALRATTINGTPAQQSAWWKERRVLAREALGAGRPEQAYALAAVHGLKRGLYLAQAEFLAGWIALVHLAQPALAYGHFVALREVVSKPRSVARAQYWLGRALSKLGLPQSARASFAGAARHARTFYGQLALDIVAEGGTEKRKPVSVGEAAKQAFETREPARMARMLAKAERRGLAAAFLFARSDRSDSHEELVLLARLARELKLPHVSLRIAKRAEARGFYMGTMAYPGDILPSFTQLNEPVEATLIHSLIRQESEFNAKARSWAGARGLMQLMPRTARLVARQHKQRYRRARLTGEPAYNLQIGTAHLRDLLDNHGGSFIMALASYNAGPGRTLKWAKTFGDPRSPEVDPVDWIESIPFDETRDYVQKVMENLQVYRSYMTPGASRSLTRDLRRGTLPPEPARDARDAGKTADRKKKS